MKKVMLILMIFLFLGGCEGTEVHQKNFIYMKNFEFTPTTVTLYGNKPFKIESLSFPSDITWVVVKISDRKAYNVRVNDDVIEGILPGLPSGGEYDVKIFTNKGNFILQNAIRYKPLNYPIFKRMVAIGASYTHGFVSMGINWQIQQYSPFAQVARQVGAYFPQALVRKGIIPPKDPKALLESCTGAAMTPILLKRIMRTLRLLRNSEGKNLFSLATYRVDPDVVSYNAGIGGATIQDTVEGPRKGRIPELAVLESLVFAPYRDIFIAFSPPPMGSPLAQAIALKPTILFSTDLYADDILEFALIDGTPSLQNITPVNVIKKELNKIFALLNQNRVEAFIANMPDITAMPVLHRMRNSLLWAGYSKKDVNKWWYGLKHISAEYSIAFTEVASRYNNIHIVDFRGYINKIMESRNGKKFVLDDGTVVENGGIKVGNKLFTIDYLGGLVSLDAVHLTYTGYALIANMFIDEVDKAIGYKIPFINLADVSKDDPLTPQKLKDIGIDIEECRRAFLNDF